MFPTEKSVVNLQIFDLQYKRKLLKDILSPAVDIAADHAELQEFSFVLKFVFYIYEGAKMKNKQTYIERRVAMIRAIAKELRDDRNMPATKAMKIARRYTNLYCK